MVGKESSPPYPPLFIGESLCAFSPCRATGKPLPGRSLTARDLVHEMFYHLARPSICAAASRGQKPTDLCCGLRQFSLSTRRNTLCWSDRYVVRGGGGGGGYFVGRRYLIGSRVAALLGSMVWNKINNFRFALRVACEQKQETARLCQTTRS